MLSARQLQIAKYLLAKGDYVTLAQIASEFDVSQRTVRNDLDAIEFEFRSYPAAIERKPHIGIRLHLEKNFDLEAVLSRQELKVPSKEERAWKIIVILAMRGKTTTEALADELQISKNTAITDLRLAESLLQQHDIFLTKNPYYGIEIEGEETKIRTFLYNLHIQELSATAAGIADFLKRYITVPANAATDLIHYIERMEKAEYSDRALKELEGILLVILSRMAMGNHVPKTAEMRSMEDDELYLCLQHYFLTADRIPATDGDICYLSVLFRSAQQLHQHKNTKEQDEGDILLVCQSLVEEFAQTLKIEIDLEADLVKKLVTHLKIAVMRMKNHIKIENVLLSDIQYSTSFMYDLTRKLLRKYEARLGVQFPDEETAFITIYFESLFQEFVHDKPELKIVIVCNGGMATSTLLKQRLSLFLPQLKVFKILRVSSLSDELPVISPDLIISTLSLQLSGYNQVKVNPILNPEDVQKITAAITKLSYKKQTDQFLQRIDWENSSQTYNLLRPEYCQFQAEVTDWKDAIWKAAQPLVKAHKIKEAYIQEMIRVVQEMGNYMVFIPEIAFVHAKPDHVLETSIAVLNLKESIDFGSKTISRVKVIVVVANKEQNQMLSNLVKLLLIDDNIERFKAATEYGDLLGLKEG